MNNDYEKRMEELLENNFFHKKMQDFLKEKESLKKKFDDFIDDKSFSLNERWEVYFQYAEEFYPEIEDWIVHLTSFDVSEYFRDSISGRGSVVDLLSTIHDKNWELNTFDLDDIYPDFNTQEKMDAIREEIIQNRYTKFAFDW